MSLSSDPAPIRPDDLEQQVLLLASRDWKTRRAARDALVAAGVAGRSAAMEGLRHPEPPVRRGCADDLRRVALHDPIPRLRRFAVHALGCVTCKPSPLDIDLIEFFAEVAARSDESAKVRREAIYALSHQPQDSRATAALRSVLEQETDQELRKAAHRVLRLHDPDYRRLTDEQARQASLARTSRAAC